MRAAIPLVCDRERERERESINKQAYTHDGSEDDRRELAEMMMMMIHQKDRQAHSSLCCKLIAPLACVCEHLIPVHCTLTRI